MSELNDILAFYESAHQRVSGTNKFALATIVRTAGPSYRSAGARSVVNDLGVFRGGVSAGCLEADVACRLDSETKPFIVHYDLAADDEVRGFPFGCGGNVDIFVEPLPNELTLDSVRWLARLEEPAVMLTVVQVDGKCSVELGARFGISESATEVFNGTLHFDGMQQLCVSALAEIKSKVLSVKSELGAMKIFVEYFEPAVSLIIYGDAEDARDLETMAVALGYSTCRVSRSELRSGVPIVKKYPRVGHVYNVVMTHDLHLDTFVMEQLLQAKPPYLGVLGPRSRTDRMLADIGSRNSDNAASKKRVAELIGEANLFAPIGLNMGAETPKEIALSILSEIQTVRKGRSPSHLRDVDSPIHGARTERATPERTASVQSAD